MLRSIGIQRSHLLSLSPQHPLPRSIAELSFKSPLIPREQSQSSRGIVRIMCFVSHKSHYHIFSGIHRSKINQIGLTREPHSILPQLAPMNIRLHDQQISRIPKGSLLSQLMNRLQRWRMVLSSMDLTSLDVSALEVAPATAQVPNHLPCRAELEKSPLSELDS